MTGKLASKLLPLTSPPLHFNTCAVVGNSGSLKRAAHGAAIDLHDAVLRLNQVGYTYIYIYIYYYTTILLKPN
jgi:hypothetical protein